MDINDDPLAALTLERMDSLVLFWKPDSGSLAIARLLALALLNWSGNGYFYSAGLHASPLCPGLVECWSARRFCR